MKQSFHRLFNTPAQLGNSLVRDIVVAMEGHAQLSKAGRYSSVCKSQVISFITILLLTGGPLTVAGFITPVDVYAFNSQCGRTLTHVRKEVIEAEPSFTYHYPTTTIIHPRVRIRISAPPQHRGPNAVGSGVRTTMSGIHELGYVGLVATARLNTPTPQFGLNGQHLLSADTNTFTRVIDSTAPTGYGVARANDCQSCKCGTGRDRFSSRHNVVRPALCAAAGAQLQLSIRCESYTERAV